MIPRLISFFLFFLFLLHIHSIQSTLISPNRRDIDYFLSSRSLSNECQISNCKKCSDEDPQKCKECYRDYAFFNNECISYDEIIEKDFIESCDAYDKNYKCIRCKSDCSLKNGKCKCSLNMTILIIIVISFGVLILTAILVALCFLKKSAEKEHSNQPVTPPISVEEKKKNNSKKPQKVENKKIIETNTKTEETFLTNDTYPICSQCKIEKANYQLSCGCYICQKDIGKFIVLKLKELKFNKSEGDDDGVKCEVCKETIVSIKKIMSKCRFCSESNKFLLLNGKNNFEICIYCYEKLVKNEKSSEIKENKINIPIIRENSNQTSNETRI